MINILGTELVLFILTPENTQERLIHRMTKMNQNFKNISVKSEDLNLKPDSTISENM